MLLLSLDNLIFTNIFINIVITGILATLITNGIFFVAFRIFQYDYIFLEETGSMFVDESELTAGLLTHLLVGILITAIYALPYLLTIIFLTNNEFGVYKYDPVDGTAIRENLFHFLPFTVMVYIIWWIVSLKGENEKQSGLLLIYSIIFSLVAGIIYGLYGFGLFPPGIIYS
ncbi:MAG: hypothetical protein ACW981_00510 [Candidatus Hodarchaeales archaeon]